MGQNKERLTKLLEFVTELYDHPGNEDFVDGIRDLVMNDKEFKKQFIESLASYDSGALDRVEKYLSLDFRIDDKEMPDYSRICDGEVRDKLTSDFREMLRYRFGTRNHKVDFPEFCRYATMQTEMLVNYYYDKRFNSDIDQIKAAVVNGNYSEREGKSFYTPSPYTSVVSDIPLKSKVQALQKQFDWQYLDIVIFLNIIEVRNLQSHRSLLKNKDLIKEIEGNPDFFDPNGRFDKEKAKNSVGTKKMGEYWFQVWLDQQPFDKVIAALERLCTAVTGAIGGAI